MIARFRWLLLSLVVGMAFAAGCALVGGGGGPAPDLLLADTGGQQFRLSELRGQPLLLYFSYPG